jgi:lysyl-tRNA synthetase class I
MSDANTVGAFLLMHDIIPEENCLEWGDKMSRAIPDLVERLRGMNIPCPDMDIQTVFYDVGKQYIGESKEELRKFFEILYCIFLNSHTGSRWGMMVNIIGKEDFLFRLEYHFENLLFVPVRKA